MKVLGVVSGLGVRGAPGGEPPGEPSPAIVNRLLRERLDAGGEAS